MGVGDIVKKVRHPEEKLRESKRVNQVAGLLGRGKEEKKHTEQARNHASRPIGSLQDPSSFGAPPKHRDWYGDKTATASIPTSASSAAATQVPVPPRATGAPTTPTQLAHRPGPAVPPRIGTPRADQEPSEPPEKPAGPFRIDTTGLSTTGLPAPPTHRDKTDISSAQSSGTESRYSSKANMSRGLTQSNMEPLPPPPTPPRSRVVRGPPPPTRLKPILPPRATMIDNSNNIADTPQSPPPPY